MYQFSEAEKSKSSGSETEEIKAWVDSTEKDKPRETKKEKTGKDAKKKKTPKVQTVGKKILSFYFIFIHSKNY